MLISDAAKYSGIKEADCEELVKRWLKYAGDRDGGRKKRAEKQKRKYSWRSTLSCNCNTQHLKAKIITYDLYKSLIENVALHYIYIIMILRTQC